MDSYTDGLPQIPLTPGPWEVVDGDNIVSTGKDPLFIASTSDRQRMADATFIAASPDLLEALEGLLKRYTQLVNCGDCGNWDPEKEDDVIASRAAIAKAKGTA